MTRWQCAALLLALLPGASGTRRQPATAAGAVAASEKLAPKTTPIGMVLTLLKDLTAKVEAEGKEEAAAYDKYACFCKEQADGKLYNIESSTKKIEGLDAKIKELEASLIDLSTKISTQSTNIENADAELQRLDANRTAEHEQYEIDAAELEAAIKACKLAAEALQDIKAAMEGKAQTEALLQVHAAATKVSRKGIVVLTAEQKAALKELASDGARAGRAAGPADGDAYSSKFHSNEVMELIDKLYDEFVEAKNTLDSAEFESKKFSDNMKLAETKNKKFAEADKEALEKMSAKQTAEKEAATEERYVENRAKNQDQEFLDVLTGQCQEKATLWDQRSKQRAGELSALAEATEALESGAAPNAKANKKLVDLQVHAHQQAPSFIQLRGRGDRDKRQKVTSLLNVASTRLQSSVLAMASLRVEASDDHFVKVRQLMKDIVKRLEAEATLEQEKKKICDRDISAAVKERDEASAAIESQSKDKAINEASSADLAMEMAELSKQIAANKKELFESSELRAAESKENEMTYKDAKAGLEAVEKAITILEGFYDQAATALVQAGAPKREDELRFRSANGDREGNTVADLAPDASFGSTYKGQQEASTGIIGTLQVIKSDFTRTMETTEDEESKAEGEFQILKDASEQDTQLKMADKDDKDTKKVAADEAVLSLETELVDSKKAKDAAESTLEKLRESCIEPEETYEERVAKRDQEIEALKEAHAILEDW